MMIAGHWRSTCGELVIRDRRGVTVKRTLINCGTIHRNTSEDLFEERQCRISGMCRGIAAVSENNVEVVVVAALWW